jgi:L-2,4-diaminobutyrate transaminase
VSERVWQVLKDASPQIGPVMHGFTYSGHPLSAAIGVANLDIMERENLPENAGRVGSYFLERLKDVTAKNPFVGDVRGQGLVLGVEYVADRKTRRAFDPKAGAHRLVSAKCLEEGLLARALPFIDVMAFSPALTITRAEIDEVVARYGRALTKATPELERLAGA